MGPQFVRARASRMRCSSTALSAHGHDRGTGRRGAHHAPLARSAVDARRKRSHAVVTVVGEQLIERATWRADSPPTSRVTISRFARGPNLHLPSVMCPALQRALRWLAPLTLRRRPDTSLAQPANPSIRSAGSTASAHAVSTYVRTAPVGQAELADWGSRPYADL